jgi:hypothetical protein
MELMQLFNIKKKAFGKCASIRSLCSCYKLDESPIILKESCDILGQGFTKLTSKHGGHVKPFLKYKFEK